MVLVLAWEVEALLTEVASNDILGSNLVTEGVDKGDSDLALASSQEDPALLPGCVLRLG